MKVQDNTERKNTICKSYLNIVNDNKLPGKVSTEARAGTSPLISAKYVSSDK